MPSTTTCYNRALDALARRSRSARDLERWLRDRDYSPDEVGETLERLTAAGLLNDAKFAEAFARSRLVDRGMSKRRVSAELARHGVAREIIDAAIAAVITEDEVDEESAVLEVAQKKWRSLSRLEPLVAKRRLMGFLARRGYDGDAVRRAVAQVAAG